MKKAAMASLVSLLTLTGSASAQQPVPPGPAPASGPLVLQPINNSFVLAPEVKVVRFDDRTSAMAGGYVGWIKDDHLLIGGGGYASTNRRHDQLGLAYGGAVVGWFFNPEQKISVSAKSLVGIARTTQTTDRFGIPYCMLPEEYLCSGPSGPVPLVHNVKDRWYDDDDDLRRHATFLMAEPEVNVVAKLGKRLRLTAGAGYRLTGARNVYGASKVARGPSGTVAVQFNFK